MQNLTEDWERDTPTVTIGSEYGGWDGVRRRRRRRRKKGRRRKMHTAARRFLSALDIPPLLLAPASVLDFTKAAKKKPVAPVFRLRPCKQKERNSFYTRSYTILPTHCNAELLNKDKQINTRKHAQAESLWYDTYFAPNFK